MKTAIIIIHGMGNQKKDYSLDFQNRIKNEYKNSGKNPDDLVFKEVLWAGLVESQEQELFRRVKFDLSYLGLRRFIIHSLGDVIAYQKTGSTSDIYDKIHGIILEKYNDAINEVGNDGELAFVAHSLGAAILSNFIYDNQKAGKDIKFRRLFTFGTTLPLWALRHSDMDKPIILTNGQKWFNMFDSDDVLGYPLGSISDEYDLLVKNSFLEDREVNAGSILTSWNPLCHNGYWADNDVIDIITQEL